MVNLFHKPNDKKVMLQHQNAVVLGIMLLWATV